MQIWFGKQLSHGVADTSYSVAFPVYFNKMKLEPIVMLIKHPKHSFSSDQ